MPSAAFVATMPPQSRVAPNSRMSVRYASLQPARSPATNALDHRRAEPGREVGVGAEVALAAEREARERVHRTADVHVGATVDRLDHLRRRYDTSGLVQFTPTTWS